MFKYTGYIDFPAGNRVETVEIGPYDTPEKCHRMAGMVAKGMGLKRLGKDHSICVVEHM